MNEDEYDVIVVGAGNAGLCAALAAREQSARVLLLEKSPKCRRGGNTRFSGGGFRFAYDSLADIRPVLPELSDDEAGHLEVGSYTAADFYRGVMQVTQHEADERLTETLAEHSYPTVRWLHDQGVKWILSTGSHAVRKGDRLHFPPGRVITVNDSGDGLIRTLFARAEDSNIDILYEARASGLLTDANNGVCGVEVETGDGRRKVTSGSVVLAAGGFEANAEMRARHLGPGWDAVKVRGSRDNSGEVLTMALDIGAQPTGQWDGCHAVLVDAEAPEVEAAYEHRYSYPYGIMVDFDGNRFADEGEDFFPYTYAKLGKAVLDLPWRTAFQIFDSKTKPLLRSEYNRGSAFSAETIAALGRRLGLQGDGLAATVADFNAAINDAPFDPATKDGKATVGIAPAKSNWAQPLDTPPFYGYPVTCGITFTFGGLKITEKAEVVDTDGDLIEGLFAAGEITGGSFHNNYPGGAGLTKGAVFGRVAGMNAARKSRNRAN